MENLDELGTSLSQLVAQGVITEAERTERLRTAALGRGVRRPLVLTKLDEAREKWLAALRESRAAGLRAEEATQAARMAHGASNAAHQAQEDARQAFLEEVAKGA